MADTKDTRDFFDRYARFISTSGVGTRLPGGGRSPRLPARYKAIVEQNRALFAGAKVLDIASHDGRWSMAALDAGAKEVVGVEGRRHLVASAYRTFSHYGVKPAQYQFIVGDIFDALPKFEPGEFDLVLCLGFFYHTTRHHELFAQLGRLRLRSVILDTEIVQGSGPIVRFKIERTTGDQSALADMTGFPTTISGSPNHEMIVMLARHFDFVLRTVDWNGLGIKDWTGLDDYKADRRRTYVLERSVSCG